MRWEDSENTNTLVINANGITLNGKNAYQFMTVGYNHRLILNNAVLTNFKSDGGGAIFGDDDSTIIIKKSTFKNNVASDANGGAIYVHSTLEVTDSQFTSNTANYYGGAIHSYYANIDLNNVTFKSNKVLNGSGGAIGNYYGEIYINNSVFTSNIATDNGGAIYSDEGYLNVKKSKFTSNTAESWGGAINIDEQTSYFEDNIFNKNQVHSTEYYTYGGAIGVYYGETTIINNKFTDNRADDYAGAIFNQRADSTVENNTFNNNQANFGGAIYNAQADLTVKTNNFINNSAISGGAICNYGRIFSYSITHYDAWGQPSYTTYHLDYTGNIWVNNNIFLNNYAEDGGAISTSVEVYQGLPSGDLYTNNEGVQITDNTFINNTASDYGGAINSEDGNYTYIMNNTFSGNSATDGGAVFVSEYCKDDINVGYNIFIKNTANSGSAISTSGNGVWIISNTFTQNDLIGYSGSSKEGIFGDIDASDIRDNTNASNTYYPGQIYTDGVSLIDLNVFDDARKTTKLTINPIATSSYNDVINITGKFTNQDGAPLRNSNVKVTINGVTYTVKTDNNGIYRYEYRATIVGKNNLTVSYPGNKRYYSTQVKKTFTVSKKDTKLTINSIATVKYNDKVTVTGKFTNADGVALKNSNVKVTVNGNVVSVTTDENGVYNYTFSAKVVGKNNVTVSYAGNAKYNAFSVSKSFTVNKKDTKLTVNRISQTTKGKKCYNYRKIHKC